VKHARTEPGSGGEEPTNGGTTRRHKGDVALPEAFAGLAWANPELGLGINAEADDLVELHDAATAEGGENGVEKRSAPGNVGTLNREVIEHGHIFGESMVTR
jgi:hypothetical protein